MSLEIKKSLRDMDRGIKRVEENRNLEIKQSKCFIDGANVALYPNRVKPTLKNIKMVINELKNYFDLNPVSIYVIWKPVLRHHLPDEEKAELSKLEKLGILIQSFQGPGATDDTLLLKYAEEFISKGDKVYIVTNDNFKDHWDNFQWYEDYQNRIEFRIIEDKVIFNPQSLNSKKIETIDKEIDVAPKPVSSKYTVKITPISQIPIDQRPLIISDIHEFLTLVNTNNIDQIFLTRNEFWFMMQGKLVTHSLKTAINVASIEEYLYVLKWGLHNPTEYENWKNLKLEEKGYPNYQAYQNFVKIISQDQLPFGNKNSDIYNDICNQWVKIKAKYSKDSPPNYEPLVLKDIYWIIWLLAQENGWPSLEKVFERFYELLDPDILATDSQYTSELLQQFYSKKMLFFQNINDSSEMRKKIWDSYSIKTINSQNEHFYFPLEDLECQEIVVKLKKSDIFQQNDDETQKTISQIVVWEKAKKRGWTNYRDLLNLVKKDFSMEFWKNSIDGNKTSWQELMLEGIKKYFKVTLAFFAEMSPNDALSVTLKEERGTLGFYMGSQKIFDTNPNFRRDMSSMTRRR